MIVGNLDVAADWRRALVPGRPRPMVRLPVLRVVSATATLLRVFAAPGEELWTPLPVAAARLPRIDGVADVRLVDGPRPRDARLWWGEPTATAARCDHRALALEVQRALGCALDGVALVSDLAVLDGPAAARPWVLKAPLSAAGRDRVLGDGPPDRGTHRAARNLLEAHGELLFEPWHARTADYGCCGRVEEDGRARVATLHRLDVDGRGRFEGIRLDEVPEADARAVRDAFAAAARRLHGEGFRGAFGVDAWRAGPLLQPLGEINARLTFGHVARAWADRLGLARARFAVGRAGPPEGATPLLLPGDDDPTAAWIGPIGAGDDPRW